MHAWCVRLPFSLYITIRMCMCKCAYLHVCVKPARCHAEKKYRVTQTFRIARTLSRGMLDLNSGSPTKRLLHVIDMDSNLRNSYTAASSHFPRARSPVKSPRYCSTAFRTGSRAPIQWTPQSVQTALASQWDCARSHCWSSKYSEMELYNGEVVIASRIPG